MPRISAFVPAALIGGAMLAASAGSTHAADITFRTVAITGMQAPGTPDGAVFSVLNPPLIDASGRVAFAGTLQTDSGGVTSGTNSGLWYEAGGTLTLMARTGSPAPDTPDGATFLMLGVPVLDWGGHLAFNGTLAPGSGGVTSSNNTGIWSNASGTTQLIAREGSQAPGAPAGANFNSFLPFVRSNASGQMAFSGSLQTTGGGVTDSSDAGVWSNGSGTLALIAREGSQAPGAAAGAFFMSFGAVPVINNSGQVAFSAGLMASGGDITPDNRAGIWSEGGGTLQLVARGGSQAPGTPVGTNFGSTFSIPVINDAGNVAFAASLQAGTGDVTADNNQGVWTGGADSLALVARKGDHAPGTPVGTNFRSMSDPLLAANGSVAFNGNLQGADVTINNDEGVWVTRNGTLMKVAREGDQAAGTPSGAVFGDMALPTINGSGRVAFTSALQVGPGGVTAANDYGLWAEGPAGELVLVVREGDAFAVADGDVRTVGFVGTPIALNVVGSFNDDFTLTFRLNFTDGSTGIFTATVPEPSGLALLAFASVAMRRRRRNRLGR